MSITYTATIKCGALGCKRKFTVRLGRVDDPFDAALEAAEEKGWQTIPSDRCPQHAKVAERGSP